MAVAHKGSISMGLVLISSGMYKTTVDNAFIQMGFPRQVSETDILVYCDK